MTKAYENQWGMYCSGDAEYYQKRGRVWFEDYQSDLETFGQKLSHPHVCSVRNRNDTAPDTPAGGRNILAGISRR